MNTFLKIARIQDGSSAAILDFQWKLINSLNYRVWFPIRATLQNRSISHRFAIRSRSILWMHKVWIGSVFSARYSD